ncbi:MAG: RNA pseudouridine synthase [Treponema sp.]|jgi:23S rRNA pseudouridine1911/1915/1917 synthase|nr:RNA pseudouridine synthase [Treponema sp.]
MGFPALLESGEPFILAEEAAYLVAYKPPDMHSVPLKSSQGPEAGTTLLAWCAEIYPELLTVRGWHPWEGGIVHRLDYATSGLVLFGRNTAALRALRDQQGRSFFRKEYTALSAGPSASVPPGFPPRPRKGTPPAPAAIISAFRPYGPGGKAVRPVNAAIGPAGEIPGPKLYQTDLAAVERQGGLYAFRLGINRGFRHQIRCHLAWLGYPILNDPLYGGAAAGSCLALQAWKIAFQDPLSGQRREYALAGSVDYSNRQGLTEAAPALRRAPYPCGVKNS